jgi:endonuclease III
MKHTPGPDTEKSLTDRIAFYESGAEYYAAHCETRMAEWSRGMAKQAAEQLDALKGVGRESGDGE